MIRNAILAVVALAGLIGGTELTNNAASAESFLRVGGRHGGVAVVVGTRPVYPATVVYATPTPVIVVPARCTYEVRYVDCGVWRCYGTFTSEMYAIGVAEGLRARGVQAVVERH